MARRFVTLTGVTLVVQSFYTARVLSAALPKQSGGLRFAHACLPLAPTFGIMPVALAYGCAVVQAISGCLMAGAMTLVWRPGVVRLASIAGLFALALAVNFLATT